LPLLSINNLLRISSMDTIHYPYPSGPGKPGVPIYFQQVANCYPSVLIPRCPPYYVPEALKVWRKQDAAVILSWQPLGETQVRHYAHHRRDACCRLGGAVHYRLTILSPYFLAAHLLLMVQVAVVRTIVPKCSTRPVGISLR
jgi:hypothetical protein